MAGELAVGSNPGSASASVLGSEGLSAGDAATFDEAFAKLLPKAGASFLMTMASDVITELQQAGDENSNVGGPE